MMHDGDSRIYYMARACACAAVECVCIPDEEHINSTHIHPFAHTYAHHITHAQHANIRDHTRVHVGTTLHMLHVLCELMRRLLSVAFALAQARFDHTHTHIISDISTLHIESHLPFMLAHTRTHTDRNNVCRVQSSPSGME